MSDNEPNIADDLQWLLEWVCITFTLFAAVSTLATLAKLITHEWLGAIWPGLRAGVAAYFAWSANRRSKRYDGLSVTITRPRMGGRP